MFQLQADKTRLAVGQREPLTSGSVNVFRVRFEFSADWDGLERTAVFKGGGVTRSILLDETNECVVPWETLERCYPSTHLQAGVFGTENGETVLPTIWADLGLIAEGVTPGRDAQPPTPSLWQQELARKADGLKYDGQNLSLMRGKSVLSTVKVPEDVEPVPGPPGADGFSPSVTVTDIDGGHRVTVTSADGEQSFDVLDGAEGKTGPQGKPGDQGPPGEELAVVPGDAIVVNRQDAGYRVSLDSGFAARMTSAEREINGLKEAAGTNNGGTVPELSNTNISSWNDFKTKLGGKIPNLILFNGTTFEYRNSGGSLTGETFYALVVINIQYGSSGAHMCRFTQFSMAVDKPVQDLFLVDNNDGKGFTFYKRNVYVSQDDLQHAIGGLTTGGEKILSVKDATVSSYQELRNACGGAVPKVAVGNLTVKFTNFDGKEKTRYFTGVLTIQVTIYDNSRTNVVLKCYAGSIMLYDEGNGFKLMTGDIEYVAKGETIENFMKTDDTLATREFATGNYNILSVSNPNRGVLTQEEYDALADKAKTKGTYYIAEGSQITKLISNGQAFTFPTGGA